MKTIKELEQLRDELKQAYDTILANPGTDYDNATKAYAKKCYEDAEKALKLKTLNELTQESEKLGMEF